MFSREDQPVPEAQVASNRPADDRDLPSFGVSLTPQRSRINTWLISMAIHLSAAVAIVVLPVASSGMRKEPQRKVTLINPYRSMIRSRPENRRAGTTGKAQASPAALQEEAVRTSPREVRTGVFDMPTEAAPARRQGALGRVVVGVLDREERVGGPRGAGGTVYFGGFDSAGSGTGGGLRKAKLQPVPKLPYTEQARRENVTGVVVMMVRLTAQGDVQFLKLIAGLGLGLDEEAIEAVNHARCEPAKSDQGLPIDTVGTITVTFSLT